MEEMKYFITAEAARAGGGLLEVYKGHGFFPVVNFGLTKVWILPLQNDMKSV